MERHARTPGNWPERTCATSTPPIAALQNFHVEHDAWLLIFRGNDHARDLSGLMDLARP